MGQFDPDKYSQEDLAEIYQRAYYLSNLESAVIPLDWILRMAERQYLAKKLDISDIWAD